MIIASRTKLHALQNTESKLKDDLKTVKWNLTSLKNYSSSQQLKVWRDQRSYLNKRLNQVKKDITSLTSKINGAA